MQLPRVFHALLLTPFLGLGACTNQLAQDLETYCQIVMEAGGDPDLSPPDKMAKIEIRVADEVRGEEFVSMMQVVSKAPRDMRHELMRGQAKEAGLSYWRCTALDHLQAELKLYEFDRDNPPVSADDDAGDAVAVADGGDAAPEPQRAKAKKRKSKKRKKKGKRRKRRRR